METKVTTPAVKAVIISLVLIVLSLVTQFMHLTSHKGLGLIPFAILIGGIIWSAISYANQMNGAVTYGNVFTHSFKTVAALTAIMIVFTILSVKFLFPETMDQAMQEARANMEKSGNISDEQMDTALEFTKKFFVPLAIGGILLSYMIIGVIASLIGAAVAKKNPQDPFVQQG